MCNILRPGAGGLWKQLVNTIMQAGTTATNAGDLDGDQVWNQ